MTRSLGTAGTPVPISSGKGNQHLCPHALNTPIPLISLSGAGKPPHGSPVKAGDEEFVLLLPFPMEPPPTRIGVRAPGTYGR